MSKNKSPINFIEVDPNRFPIERLGGIKWEKEVNEQEENITAPTVEEQEVADRESRYD